MDDGRQRIVFSVRSSLHRLDSEFLAKDASFAEQMATRFCGGRHRKVEERNLLEL